MTEGTPLPKKMSLTRAALHDRLISKIEQLFRYPDPRHCLPALDVTLDRWIRDAEHDRCVELNYLTTASRRASSLMMRHLQARPEKPQRRRRRVEEDTDALVSQQVRQ